MPDNLFACESAGVRRKNVLTRKANPYIWYANLVEGGLA